MWTRKSYDALYGWLEVGKRPMIRKVLLADGLINVVDRLDAAKTMADWYNITKEAAEAVGAEIVEQSADQADKELDALSKSK